MLDADGNALVLKRSDDDENRPGEFDLPGGGINSGEDIHTGAAREIWEETGLRIDPSSLRQGYSLDSFSHSQPGVYRRRYLFTASLLSASEVVLSDEHSAYSWHRPLEAAEMLQHPVWTRGITYLVTEGLVNG